MQTSLSLNLILMAMIINLVSCGDKNGKEGQVRLEVANSTNLQITSSDDIPPNAVTPTYFGIKVMAASIRFVEDVTDTGAAPTLDSGFYIAPTGCTNGGKSEHKDGDTVYEYYQPPGPQSCDADAMEYLDFAQGSATVNAALNAGNYPAIPGTYNQVSICYSAIYGVIVDGHLTKIANVNTAGETTTPFGCENVIVDNFELAEGEYATVSVSYDISKGSVVTTTNPNDISKCVESETTSGTYVCVNGLNPQPSVTK